MIGKPINKLMTRKRENRNNQKKLNNGKQTGSDKITGEILKTEEREYKKQYGKYVKNATKVRKHRKNGC